MRSALPALVVAATLLMIPWSARAGGHTCACDRLAAHPFDPGRPAENAGVASQALDAAAAIAACEQALEWQPGHARLQFQLARSLYKAGRFPEAVQLVRRSAEQGYAAAERNLGYLYYRGEILAQDDTAAMAWLRKAAERGHALAQHDLGKMYERGHGAPRSGAQAAHWYHRAAQQMFTPAQHSLAYLYQSGSGVPKDRVRALKWFTIAASLGDDYSAWIGRLAAMSMPIDEIVKAQRRARYWLKANRNPGLSRQFGASHGNATPVHPAPDSADPPRAPGAASFAE